MANGFGGRLRAFLGLDTSEFDRNLRRSGQNVRGFGGEVQSSLTGAIASATGFGRTFAMGLAGGVVTAAFAGITANMQQTIRDIASIGDEAKRAGVSLEAFQEWKYVAEQNRIGVDQMVDGLKELSLRADEFVMTGAGPALEAFQRLGYSAEDLRKKLKDPSALMLEIIGRMEGLDRAAQIRIADEVFGGAGGERFVELISRGERGLRDMIARGHEVGAVMDAEMIAKADELDRRFREITTRIANLGKAVTVGVGDAIADIFDTRLSDIFADEAEARAVLGDALVDSLKGAGQIADDQVDTIRDLRNQYRDLEADARAAANEMAGSMAQADALGYDDLWQSLATVREEMMQLTDQFAAGDLKGDKFAERMAELQARAAEAFADLDSVGQAEFSIAISNLGGLGAAIQTVLTLAKSLRQNLPQDGGAEAPKVYSGRGDGSFEWRETYAPESSARPEGRTFKASEDAIWGPEVTEKGGGKKKDEDKYKAAAEAIREETAALEAEAAAFLAVSQSGREYGDAVEYARRRAELMYEAQKSGKEITPELKAEIDQLAQAYVTAGMNAEEAADRISQIEENSRRGADALGDIFLGVLNGSADAKEAVGNLLAEIAKIQFQRAVLNLGSLGGGTNWLGSLLTLPGNAGGTQNWRGGITRIHELGGEIMNLPQGTQIIPHDISKRMADGAGQASGASVINIDVSGSRGNAEIETMVSAGVQQGLAAYDRQLPTRIGQINQKPRYR